VCSARAGRRRLAQHGLRVDGQRRQRVAALARALGGVSGAVAATPISTRLVVVALQVVVGDRPNR